MKAKIIEIGNSRGIRIPKGMLEQFGAADEVLLEALEGTIIIRPIHGVRDGWEEAFHSMAKNGDDKLLDDSIVSSSWDAEEWEWK